ncbi:hypothetical protein BSZ24_25830 [Bradyrhizobium canariense]|nr:hypothetical protein BSZ24_25830 [Bradyrhizobium canariense]
MLPVGPMMRREAKAMVAYSDQAELMGAFGPRQRFVDEITIVADPWPRLRGGRPCSPARAVRVPLTGGLTAGGRTLAESCRRVADIGNIAGVFGVTDCGFTDKLGAGNDTSRASGMSRSVPTRLHLEDEGDQSIGLRDRRG